MSHRSLELGGCLRCRPEATGHLAIIYRPLLPVEINHHWKTNSLLTRASRLSATSFSGALGSLSNRGNPGCRPSALIVQVRHRSVRCFGSLRSWSRYCWSLSLWCWSSVKSSAMGYWSNVWIRRLVYNFLRGCTLPSWLSWTWSFRRFKILDESTT